MRIWEKAECIHINKGVLQGGISSPYLFLLAADDLTQEMDKCVSDPNNRPVTTTWADDITVIASSHLDCVKVLYAQKRISK